MAELGVAFLVAGGLVVLCVLAGVWIGIGNALSKHADDSWGMTAALLAYVFFSLVAIVWVMLLAGGGLDG